MTVFPSGVFVMRYKNVDIYTKDGNYLFLLGWSPQIRVTLRAAKLAITKWRNT